MASRKSSTLRAALASLLLSGSGAFAETPSQTDLAKELNLATSAATAVVASLQGQINAAKLQPSDIAAPTLQKALVTQFEKIGGGPFDAAPDPARAEIRKAVAGSFGQVIEKFSPDMLKGGQDAFVPAFFRAQLLLDVNEKLKGKYRAFVTMRSSELINRDSAVERFVTEKEMLTYLQGLLENGEGTAQSKTFDGRLVSYFPMKIAEPCAACHQRIGLDQKVGAYGGATIVMVEGK